MKGLLLNNYYSAIGNIKLFLLVCAAFASVLLVTGNPTAQELFFYVTITILPANGVVSMRKDTISRWNKYELTMPVRRIDVVRSSYISYGLWLLGSCVVAILITALASFVHHGANLPQGGESLVSMLSLGAGIAFLGGTYFYPLSYGLGAEKSETLLIASVILSIGTAILGLNILNKFFHSFYVRITIFTLLYIGMFILSYLITLLIYKKKGL